MATYNRLVQLIPPKARMAVLTGALVLVGSAVYTSLSGGSATLNLICRHDFRSTDISVAIDGRTTASRQEARQTIFPNFLDIF